MTATEARRALAKAEPAFRELLICLELCDAPDIPGGSTVRWLAGCSEDRYQGAKATARLALDEITALRRGAR